MEGKSSLRVHIRDNLSKPSSPAFRLKKKVPFCMVSMATVLPTFPSSRKRETRVPSFTPSTLPSIVYSCCACETRLPNKKRLLNSSFFIIIILEVIIRHKVKLFFIECYSFYCSLIFL